MCELKEQGVINTVWKRGLEMPSDMLTMNLVRHCLNAAYLLIVATMNTKQKRMEDRATKHRALLHDVLCD